MLSICLLYRNALLLCLSTQCQLKLAVSYLTSIQLLLLQNCLVLVGWAVRLGKAQ